MYVLKLFTRISEVKYINCTLNLYNSKENYHYAHVWQFYAGTEHMHHGDIVFGRSVCI